MYTLFTTTKIVLLRPDGGISVVFGNAVFPQKQHHLVFPNDWQWQMRQAKVGSRSGKRLKVSSVWNSGSSVVHSMRVEMETEVKAINGVDLDRMKHLVFACPNCDARLVGACGRNEKCGRDTCSNSVLGDMSVGGNGRKHSEYLKRVRSGVQMKG